MRRPRRFRAALTGVARRPGQVAWLWLVWVLMWGQLTRPTVVLGLLVAVAVLAAFPSPGPEPADPGAPSRLAATGAGRRRRWRPSKVVMLVLRLVADLIPASMGVAGQMIRLGPATPSAIISVPLRAGDEVAYTLVANAISLAPGVAVIHVDRDQGVFYVHALTTGGATGVEKVRGRVDDVQRRVLAALGADPAGGGPAR